MHERQPRPRPVPQTMTMMCRLRHSDPNQPVVRNQRRVMGFSTGFLVASRGPYLVTTTGVPKPTRP